jgi:dihydrofolate reductase
VDGIEKARVTPHRRWQPVVRHAHPSYPFSTSSIGDIPQTGLRHIASPRFCHVASTRDGKDRRQRERLARRSRPGPAGDEGFRVGGWVGLIKDRPQLNKVALDEALGAEALLLGRRSYEWFAARWPSRSGELADRLNGMPKYVVSSTLEDPDWNNSTVLKGDVLHEVSKLKQELNGEILVPASFQLLRTLIEHDLVDELRLKVFPVVLGAGERLFGETSDKKPMHLVETQTVADGIAFLTYEPV